MKYAIVIENAGSNYSGYVPDLPGLAVTAATVREAKQLLEEGIDVYLEELREQGLPMPEPSAIVDYAER